MSLYINIHDNPLKVKEIPNGVGAQMGYRYLSPETWYNDGYREYVKPTEFDSATHKLGAVIYNEATDRGTNEIVALTQEELDAKAAQALQDAIDYEVQRQIERETRGKDEFRLMTAQLRAQVGSGLDLTSYNALELTLEPLGDIIQQGKWTKGYNWLIDLGSSIIGLELYNTLLTRLTVCIEELYDEHDWPWTT